MEKTKFNVGEYGYIFFYESLYKVKVLKIHIDSEGVNYDINFGELHNIDEKYIYKDADEISEHFKLLIEQIESKESEELKGLGKTKICIKSGDDVYNVKGNFILNEVDGLTDEREHRREIFEKHRYSDDLLKTFGEILISGYNNENPGIMKVRIDKINGKIPDKILPTKFDIDYRSIDNKF